MQRNFAFSPEAKRWLSMALRWLVPFGSGLLFGFFLIVPPYVPVFVVLNGQQDAFGVAVQIVLFLAPICVGIAAALTVNRRKKNLIVRAVGRGLLIITGIGIPILSFVWQQGAEIATYCRTNYCHGGVGSALVVPLLYLLYSIVFMLLSSVITGFIRAFQRKKRERQGEEKARA